MFCVFLCRKEITASAASDFVCLLLKTLTSCIVALISSLLWVSSVFFFLMTCLQHLVQQMISEVHKMLSEFFLSGKNMINKLVDISWHGYVVSCCRTAVFLLFSLPKRHFLLFFLSFNLSSYSFPPKATYTSCPDLFTVFSAASSVSPSFSPAHLLSSYHFLIR